jgi:cytochrome bd ubiquinol oxidase subunit II
MVMLFALVFRGISFEFRARARHFRSIWTWAFGIGSLIAAFSQGMMLGKFVQGLPFEPAASRLTITVSLFPPLCGVAMIAGYTMLGAAWLVHKTAGATQTFGREVCRAAWLLTMATFFIACLWTPLSVHEVARRWFGFPQLILFGTLAVVLVAAAIAFWRSIWNSQSDARLLRLAVLMTILAFAGFAGTVWPYALPYRLSIAEAAADQASLKFVLIGIVIVLPLVLIYQSYAYRALGGKVSGDGSAYGSAVGRPARRIG